MATTDWVDLPGPAGRLEGILMTPEEEPLASGVVCHAHPLSGGMMHFKAVFRAARALVRHRVAVLRFNFRGVGKSTGVHDGGRGEQEDVRAALDEMERRYPGRAQVLGGYSFGSVMALRVGADHPRVRALFALGFPSASLPDTSFLDGCRKPRLFVQGQKDEFGPGEELLALAESLPEPRSVVILPGSDHFFNGYLDELEEAISRWIATRPWEHK
ncbi:MAG: alpha/beta hydrolase [Acidobacteriota bacterium]